VWPGTNDLIISATTIGLTFDQIAKAIGRNEVWLAAAFYGQVAYYSGSLNPNPIVIIISYY
jgi:cyanate lyase